MKTGIVQSRHIKDLSLPLLAAVIGLTLGGCPHDGDKVWQVNRTPTAEAGDNVTVADNDNDGQERVSFDGSRSQDPDGRIVTYTWRVGSTDYPGAQVTVDLPIGTHTAQLTVTDDRGQSASDTSTITVKAGEMNGSYRGMQVFNADGTLTTVSEGEEQWRWEVKGGRLVAWWVRWPTDGGTVIRLDTTQPQQVTASGRTYVFRVSNTSTTITLPTRGVTAGYQLDWTVDGQEPVLDSLMFVAPPGVYGFRGTGSTDWQTIEGEVSHEFLQPGLRYTFKRMSGSLIQ
jgi:hypothetical protein